MNNLAASFTNDKHSVVSQTLCCEGNPTDKVNKFFFCLYFRWFSHLGQSISRAVCHLGSPKEYLSPESSQAGIPGRHTQERKWLAQESGVEMQSQVLAYIVVTVVDLADIRQVRVDEKVINNSGDKHFMVRKERC